MPHQRKTTKTTKSQKFYQKLQKTKNESKSCPTSLFNHKTHKQTDGVP